MKRGLFLAAVFAAVACATLVADETINVTCNSNNGTINPAWNHHWVMWPTSSPDNYDYSDGWYQDKVPYCDWLCMGNMTGGKEDGSNDWIKDDGQGGTYYDYRGLEKVLDKVLPSGCSPLMVTATTPAVLSGGDNYQGAPLWGNVLAPDSLNDYHNYIENVVNQMEAYVSDYNTAHSTSHDVDDWRWRARTEVMNDDWFYIEAPCSYSDWGGPGDWGQYYIANDNRDAYFDDLECTVDAVADALDGLGNVNKIYMANVGHDTWGDEIPGMCADNNVRNDFFTYSMYYSQAWHQGGACDQMAAWAGILDEQWDILEDAYYPEEPPTLLGMDETGILWDENGDTGADAVEFGASFVAGTSVLGAKRSDFDHVVYWDFAYPSTWYEPFSTNIQSGAHNANILCDALRDATLLTVSPEFVSSGGKRIEALAGKLPDGTIRVLVFHYHCTIDRDNVETSENVTLHLTNLPGWNATFRVRNWRVDRYHSNAYRWFIEEADDLNYGVNWGRSPYAVGVGETYAIDGTSYFFSNLYRWTKMDDVEYYEPPKVQQCSGNTMDVVIPMPRHSVTLVEIQRAGYKNRHPGANPSKSPASPSPGDTITLDANGSDPDNDTLSYYWEFTDGTTATTEQVSRQYPRAGTYLEKVTVSDGDLEWEDDITVTVSGTDYWNDTFADGFEGEYTALRCRFEADSGAAVLQANTGQGQAVPTIGSVSFNCEFDIKHQTGTSWSAFLFRKTRMSDWTWTWGGYFHDSGYRLLIGGGGITLLNLETDEYRSASVSWTITNWQTIKVETDGDVTKVYVGGDEKINWDDEGAPDGKFMGWYVYSGTVNYDDVRIWKAGSQDSLYRPPVAKAGGYYIGRANSAVSFNSTSTDPDGDNLTYAWDFGDGSTSASEDPSHTYTSTGVYGVKLTVSDGTFKDDDYAMVTITSANTAPVAVNAAPNANAWVEIDETVILDGGASSDLDDLEWAYDDADGDDDLTYSWTVTAKPYGSTATITDSDKSDATFDPDKLGNYNMALTVTDSDQTSCGTSPYSWMIVVPDGYDGSLTILEDDLPDGTVSVSYGTWWITAVGGTCAGYSWSVQSGSLPPGLTLTGSGTRAYFSGTPTSSGNYTATIRVTDSGSNTDDQQYSWTISN